MIIVGCAFSQKMARLDDLNNSFIVQGRERTYPVAALPQNMRSSSPDSGEMAGVSTLGV